MFHENFKVVFYILIPFILISSILILIFHLLLIKNKNNLNKESRNNLMSNFIMDKINVLIFVWNIDGTISHINSYSEKITGLKKDKILNKTIDDIYSEDIETKKSFKKNFKNFRKGINIGPHENRFICSDGNILTILWIDNIISDDNSNPSYIISMGINITEMNNIDNAFKTLAFYDPITKLPNKSFLLNHLPLILKSASNDNRTVALILLDIDNFKAINDSFGYAIGDKLLENISDILKKLDESNNGIYRVGGDEFILIISPVQSKREITNLAHKIRKALSTPLTINQYEIFITTSMGISFFPDDAIVGETLFKNAENALYFIKHHGKNFYKLYDDTINIEFSEKIELQNYLRTALQNHQFEVFYQPQIDALTKEIIGMEALLRWFHPVKGPIPPSKFIPIAEESGLISQIGDFVLSTACKQNKEWQNKGYKPLRVAVNVSSYQFHQYNLVQKVQNILTETGLDPNWLELELTESSTIRDFNTTNQVLLKFKKLGIKIALDDFGTGYSSLSLIKRLPIDILKMDKSFIDDIDNSVYDKNVSAAVVFMAHSMNLSVVAEGVEKEIQYNFLKEQKCDTIQGYYFSKPLSAKDFEKLLRDYKPNTNSEKGLVC